MSYGYSTRLVKLNKKADDRMLGVRLGRVCIGNDVPVLSLAMALGVSRQTVYNWFCGITNPRAKLAVDIKNIIQSYSEDK